MIGIYEITNSINGKRYVGSSIDIHKRLISHRSQLKRNKHHCQPLQRAYNKYGMSAFNFSVIELCQEFELVEKEQRLLSLNNLYNVFKDAYSLRKENHPMYNKTHSEMAKAKIKEARSKQTISHSEETKKKIGEGNKRPGKTITPENLKKMIDARGCVWNKGIKTGISPANKISFSETDIKLIIEKYLSGESIEKIRKFFKVDWDVIKSLLLKNNIETRNISQQKKINDRNRNIG